MNILGTIAVAVVTSILATTAGMLFLAPLRRFGELRERTLYLLQYWQAFPPESEYMTDARHQMREVAASFHALRHTMRPPLPWCLRLQGYDVDTAVGHLYAVANTWNQRGGNDNAFAVHRDGTERALKLPLSYPDGIEFQGRGVD